MMIRWFLIRLLINFCLQESELAKDVMTRLEISRLLITSGAFVDAENRKGRPPITYGLPEVQMGVREFINQK
jgi:hypothetical protein